jgi:hypothetical protein
MIIQILYVSTIVELGIDLWGGEGGSGSMKADGRENKSFLVRVFNLKLCCFVMRIIAWHSQAHPDLQLKTRAWFSPVS